MLVVHVTRLHHLKVLVQYKVVLKIIDRRMLELETSLTPVLVNVHSNQLALHLSLHRRVMPVFRRAVLSLEFKVAQVVLRMVHQ